MEVAPVQRELLDFLKANLTMLDNMSGKHAKAEVAALRDRLDGWAAKVAVIGQVKAGKSTFLNAFLGQHDFLPSDINPWTSVVTNLRINMTGDPYSGAAFHFFDEADWHDMLNGTNHVRELAEELLPGFDTDLLKKQSQELKDRAQRRLGAHYHALLGSKHCYDFVTPDLLRRYVCAGPGSDEGLTRESLGRYAALTRDADIYMQIPEFQVPTIVTDTPGVNDPFLVRDEVTCRSLDKSDVFIVVLSAHQALTDVDIGLIRILAQQEGKDVIIFINRLDEVEAYDRRYERLIADVSHRLAQAVPGIAFHILTGSGFMADALLREDDEGERIREELDTPTLAYYLGHRYGTVPDTRDGRLSLGSGIGAIRETLSRVIDAGSGCNQLTQITQDMFTQISAMSVAIKRESGMLREDADKLRDGQVDGALASLETDIETIRGVQSIVDDFVAHATAELQELAAAAQGSLERDLSQIAYLFIVNQRGELESKLHSAEFAGENAYEIDLTNLHEEMEQSLSTRFIATRKRIDAILQTCMLECDETIKENFDEEFEHLSTDDLPNETFVTTLATSKKTLQANIIGERSWQFWRKKSVNAEETVVAMCKLAGAELRPTLDKLLQVYGEAQSQRITAGLRRLGILQRMLGGMLADAKQMLRDNTATLTGAAGDPSKLGTFVAEIEAKTALLDARFDQLEAINLSMSEAPILKAA